MTVGRRLTVVDCGLYGRAYADTLAPDDLTLHHRIEGCVITNGIVWPPDLHVYADGSHLDLAAVCAALMWLDRLPAMRSFTALGHVQPDGTFAGGILGFPDAGQASIVTHVDQLAPLFAQHAAETAAASAQEATGATVRALGTNSAGKATRARKQAS